MSRFKVEQVCFDLSRPGNSANFKADPDHFVAPYRLTESEKQAIKTGDIEILYKMGVLTQAIASLSRVFGYDNATYVKRLRNAAGLPEVNEQIEILTRRGSFT